MADSSSSFSFSTLSSSSLSSSSASPPSPSASSSSSSLFHRIFNRTWGGGGGVYTKIFEYSTIDDALHIRFVNKSFRQLTADQGWTIAQWDTEREKDKENEENYGAFGIFCNSSRMDLFLSSFASIRSLRLMHDNNNFTFPSTISHHRIDQLDVHSLDIQLFKENKNPLLFLSHFPALDSLTITFNATSTDTPLPFSAILSPIPYTIRSLELGPAADDSYALQISDSNNNDNNNNSTSSSSDTITEIKTFSSFPQLERVLLDFVIVPEDEAIIVIQSCPALTEIDFTICKKGSSDRLLMAIKSLSKLRSLRIRDDHARWTEEGARLFSSSHPFPPPSLTYCNIKRCVLQNPDNTDNADKQNIIYSLLSHPPSLLLLQSLALPCMIIDPHRFSSFLSSLPSLRLLDCRPLSTIENQQEKKGKKGKKKKNNKNNDDDNKNEDKKNGPGGILFSPFSSSPSLRHLSLSISDADHLSNNDIKLFSSSSMVMIDTLSIQFNFRFSMKKDNKKFRPLQKLLLALARSLSSIPSLTDINLAIVGHNSALSSTMLLLLRSIPKLRSLHCGLSAECNDYHIERVVKGLGKGWNSNNNNNDNNNNNNTDKKKKKEINSDNDEDDSENEEIDDDSDDDGDDNINNTDNNTTTNNDNSAAAVHHLHTLHLDLNDALNIPSDITSDDEIPDDLRPITDLSFRFLSHISSLRSMFLQGLTAEIMDELFQYGIAGWAYLVRHTAIESLTLHCKKSLHSDMDELPKGFLEAISHSTSIRSLTLIGGWAKNMRVKEWRSLFACPSLRFLSLSVDTFGNPYLYISSAAYKRIRDYHYPALKELEKESQGRIRLDITPLMKIILAFVDSDDDDNDNHNDSDDDDDNGEGHPRLLRHPQPLLPNHTE